MSALPDNPYLRPESEGSRGRTLSANGEEVYYSDSDEDSPVLARPSFGETLTTSVSQTLFGSELLINFFLLQEWFQWVSRSGSERHGDQHSENEHSQDQQHPGVQYEQSTSSNQRYFYSECNNFRFNHVKSGVEQRIKFSETPLQLRII